MQSKQPAALSCLHIIHYLISHQQISVCACVCAHVCVCVSERERAFLCLYVVYER